jgi:CBS domain-containing protein
VVVVDADRRVVGIITDGDLLQRSAETERSDLLRSLAARISPGLGAKLTLARRVAADVMTRDPVTTNADTPLADALRLLLTHRIKRLPVVDADGRLVGIVGRGELLRSLAEDV